MSAYTAISLRKRTWRYLCIARYAMRQQWVYRTELILRALSMILFMGVFIALWHTVYAVGGDDSVAGYSLNQIVWYLAMTETVTLSSARIIGDMSTSVKSGDVAFKLTQPLSYPITMIAQSLGDSLPRFFINLSVASALVWITTGAPKVGWQNWAAYMVTAWLAILLDTCIAVIIGLTAFWIEETSPILWIYQKLLFTVGGLFLPLEMFPDWLRRIADWLPFRFIAYVPANTFIAFTPRKFITHIQGQLLYIALIGAVAALIWHRAKRRMVIHGG